MKIAVTLNLGITAEAIEAQLNKQDVTCGDKAERYEKERKALNQLYFADVITDGELAKIEKRLFKRFTTDLKRYEGEQQ